MTTAAEILAIVEALGLPLGARVDARVPKNMFVDQGAPTSTDKRAIQDGIDELQWLAACKPSTIGVPSFSDETREYLEIAIVGCAFRAQAKASRLIELVHRAIPYPVLLITTDEGGIALSVAHKRHAEREAGKVVLERVVSVGGLRRDALTDKDQAFLRSLALANQPRRDLCTLYEGWLTRIEALMASRLNGAFAARDDAASIERRREALDAHARLTREITGLRAKAKSETQLSRRVDLNLEIKRREAQLALNDINL